MSKKTKSVIQAIENGTFSQSELNELMGSIETKLNGQNILSVVGVNEISNMFLEFALPLVSKTANIYELDSIVSDNFTEFLIQYVSTIELWRSFGAANWYDLLREKEQETNTAFDTLVKVLDKVEHTRVNELGIDRGYDKFLSIVEDKFSLLKDAIRDALLYKRSDKLLSIWDDGTPDALKAIRIETTETIAQDTKISPHVRYIGMKALELRDSGISSQWEQVTRIYHNLLVQERAKRLSRDGKRALFILRDELSIGNYKTDTEKREITQLLDTWKRRMKPFYEVTTK